MSKVTVVKVEVEPFYYSYYCVESPLVLITMNRGGRLKYVHMKL